MQKTASKGRRTGQRHHQASASDHDVEMCRRLWEEHPIGHPSHLGYKALAKIFEVPVRTIRDWVSYRHR
mgnify:CR=1 FL=1